MPETVQIELRKLFQKHVILKVQQLQEFLHGRSRRSIFRDLKEAGSISSYSHTGRYLTLKNIPQFNRHGLWQHKEVGFSRYGKLSATVEHLVHSSQGGYTYLELREIIPIRIDNMLLELTDKRGIRREGSVREYIYYSKDPARAALQRKHRNENDRQEQVEISERVVIEVLAEVIRGTKVCVELQPLNDRLQAKGVSVSIRQIAQILELYRVKKTLGSR